jgi:hypothetical protein
MRYTNVIRAITIERATQEHRIFIALASHETITLHQISETGSFWVLKHHFN